MCQLGDRHANNSGNINSASGFGFEAFRDTANNMPRMQPQSKKQKREMLGGNVQAGRGAGLLPSLRLEFWGVLR